MSAGAVPLACALPARRSRFRRSAVSGGRAVGMLIPTISGPRQPKCSKVRGCYAQTNPVNFWFCHAVYSGLVLRIAHVLQYVGAQRLTGGRGGTSRRPGGASRHWAPSALPSSPHPSSRLTSLIQAIDVRSKDLLPSLLRAQTCPRPFEFVVEPRWLHLGSRRSEEPPVSANVISRHWVALGAPQFPASCLVVRRSPGGRFPPPYSPPLDPCFANAREGVSK